MTIMCFCMPNKHSKKIKLLSQKIIKNKTKKQNTHSKQNKTNKSVKHSKQNETFKTTQTSIVH
jgi:hypothetical protein